MAGALIKLAGAELPTVLERATLPPEAFQQIRGCTDVGGTVDRLEAVGFPNEAIRVLAHALPNREGVWWACMCADHTAPPDLPEPDRLARQCAELWVRRQQDDVRRAAMAHAEAGGGLTPEAWTGIAAFWSGDSLAPLGCPPAPPPAGITGGAVAGAVTLASVRGVQTATDTRLKTKFDLRLKRFLVSGREVAAGGLGRIPPESR